MDEKRSLSFCHSPGIEMPSMRMNLESAFSEDGGKSENMSVYARVRPLLQREKEAGYCEECIGVIDDTVVRAVVPKSSLKFKNSNNNGQEIIEDFTYTHAFGPETGQFVFFENTIMSTMQSFIEGQNCLIFSYGITNSGKTYTLQGDENNPGIIILGLRLFFASIEHQLWDDIYVKPDKFADIIILNENDKMKEIKLKENLFQIYDQEVNRSCDSTASLTRSFAMTLCDCFSDKFKAKEVEETLSPEEMEAAQSAQLMKILSKQSSDQQIGKCNIWISFIEIYNEYIYDLLQPNVLERKKLQLAEDQNGDVYVKGAKEVYVSDVEEALKLLHLGRRNLRIASTKLNYQSSRSHCIYMVKVVRLDEEMSFSRVNRLSFCDLAGSERATKSKASGMRLKEASYINTSLLVLGKCLEQLRLNQTLKDKKLIPFRESKLTRLFSGHFLGKGKAVMIANASPCEYTFDETLNVLRFSAVAKELILNDSYIKMASNSLQSITSQWVQTKGDTSRFSLDQSCDFDNSFMDELKVKDEMIEKLLDLADSLRNNLEEEKRQKAQLEITIRQDVCREYSEYSDELLERQKEAYEDRIENLKEIYNQRIQDVEKLKDEKIKALKEELAEYDDSDESFNKSVDKSRMSNSKVVESPKSAKQELVNHILNDEQKHDIDFDANIDMPDSDTLFKELENQIEENRVLKLDLCSLKNQLEMSSLELEKSKEEIIQLQNEITKFNDQVSSMKVSTDDLIAVKSEQKNEIEKLSADIISLKDDLNNVNTEFNKAKDQVEQTSLLLKDSQSRESSALNKCADFEMKLQEALQVLEEYEKEIVQLKSAITAVENKCTELETEKQNLGNTVVAVSEELASATALVEKLKTEKLEAEKAIDELVKTHEDSTNQEIQNLRHKLTETESLYSVLKDCKTGEMTELEELVAELKQKLEETNKSLVDQKSKFIALESDCEAYKNESVKLFGDCKSLETEITSVTTNCENLKRERDNLEKVNEELSQSVKLGNNKLEEKITELNKKLVNSLGIIEEQESLNAKLKKDNDRLQEDCSTFEKKVSSLRESYEEESVHKKDEINLKLKEALEEIETLNSKISVMESECKTHVEDYNSLVKDFQNLESDFKATTNKMDEESGHKEEAANLKLKEAMEKIEMLKSKISTMESECNTHVEDYNKLTKDFQNLESDFKATTDKMEETSLHKQDEISLKLYEALEEIETQNTKISKMELECKTHMDDYNKLMKEFQDLESEFKSAMEQMSVKEKNTLELNSKLEKSVQSLLEQETKFSDLLSEYETCKSENIQLIEKCKSLEELMENNKGEINEINLKLDVANTTIEQQKLICDEIKSNYEHATKSIENLQNEKNVVENERNEMKTTVESMAEEIENVRNERNSFEEALSKMKINADNANRKNTELLETADILEQKNTKISSLESLCSSHEEEIAKLKEMNESLKENCTYLSTQLNTVKSESAGFENKLLNATNTLKDLDSSLQKLQDECSSYENALKKLEDEKKVLEDKCNELSCNHNDQLKELRQNLENSEVTIKTLQNQTFLMETDLSAQKEENLKLKNDIADMEKEMKSLNEQLSTATAKVNELKDENQILAGNAEQNSKNDELLKLLELSEFKASEKIKLLEIESDKQKKDITDRERQIREKEDNIAELEEALLNIQKEMKNLELKHSKEMFALKQQHEVEITESMNLKSAAEKENTELKAKNNKVKTKKTSGIPKKEISSDNKENSDSYSENSKIEESKRSLSLTSQELDDDNKNKKRRALRTRQPKAVAMEESDSDGERTKVLSRKRKSSDEFIPQKKVVRKKQSKETKPAVKKTLRVEKGALTNNKMTEETENMSPVQKFAKFMGTKIRSVAESVTSMPSPRMTRGRRKLFNVETTSTTTSAKWKY